jgi:hypothetical protein
LFITPPKTLTAEDIKNAVRVYFSYKGIKLFKYEPYKKKINGVWRHIKGLGYPVGTGDLVGWSVLTGIFHVCEVKKFGDTLSDDQIKMNNLFIKDNCKVFVAYGTKENKIELENWKTKIKEVIN